ncbi:unnamed protein product [Heterobilharzia americana]|nr:unnamed protein product [Heterobilharzia americana]
MSVNLYCPSTFVVCGLWECVVMSLSSVGQICGRISVTPVVGTRREQIIKAFWLPNSIKLLAVLTDQSVQIFDVFDSPNKPKYHFKPVDGSFCDATFIRLPQSTLYPTQEQHDNNFENLISDNPFEWDIHLLVMANMGSILHQKLCPDCLSSLGPFFLAESLEWDTASLLKGKITSDELGPIPELTRDRVTGVLGGGGVSLQYISSMGLLLHAYKSGHSVASGIELFAVGSDSSSHSQDRNKLCITHSFLLATGPREVKSGDGTGSPAKPLRNLSVVSSETSHSNPDKLLISLILAAHSAAASDPSLQSTSKYLSTQLTCKPFIPCIGPLFRWTEVMGDHPGLVNCMSKMNSASSSSSNSQHKSFLMAFEPDQVLVQHLSVHPNSRMFNMYDSTVTKLTLATTATSSSTAASNFTPTSTTNASNLNENIKVINSEKSSAEPAFSPTEQFLDSFSFHWFGSPGYMSRTMTFLLTSHGHILASASVPRSSIYTLQTTNRNKFDDEVPNYELSVIPGQYWLQKDFHNKSVLTGHLLSFDCPLFDGPISNKSLVHSLPKGALWDSATTSTYQLSEDVEHENRTATIGRKPLITCIWYFTVDFFEHVIETNEVDFGGPDLLQFYNHEQLRRRLTTQGNPVTGAGTCTRKISSTVNNSQHRDDKHIVPKVLSGSATSTSTGLTSSKSKDLTAIIGQQQQHIAYVIDIYNRCPNETVLAGLRVTLPIPIDENASRWPRFSRTILVPLPYPGVSSPRTIDLPLYRCEMLKSTKLLQLVVGTSDDPEDMTSIDCIMVYCLARDTLFSLHQVYPFDTVNESQAVRLNYSCHKSDKKSKNKSQFLSANTDKIKGPMDLFVMKNNSLNNIGTEGFNSDDDNNTNEDVEEPNNSDEFVKMNCNTFEHSLAFRLDRLFSTGFVTDLVLTDNVNNNNHNKLSRSYMPQLSIAKPFPSSPATMQTFTNFIHSPYFTCLGSSSSVPLSLVSNYCSLTAAITNLLCTVVHMGITSKSKEHNPNMTGVHLLMCSLRQMLNKYCSTEKPNQSIENEKQSPIGLKTLCTEAKTNPSLRASFHTNVFSRYRASKQIPANIESFLDRVLYNQFDDSQNQLTSFLQTSPYDTRSHQCDIITKHNSVLKSIYLTHRFSTQIYHLLNISPLGLIKWLSKYENSSDNVFCCMLNQLFNVFVSSLPVSPIPFHSIDPIWAVEFGVLSPAVEQSTKQNIPHSTFTVCTDHNFSFHSSSPPFMLDFKPKSYFNQSIQRFIIPLTRAIYTLLLSSTMNNIIQSNKDTDLDELIMTSLIKPSGDDNEQDEVSNVESLNYGKLLIKLLVQSNTLVSCATRDALCRLLLRAKPKGGVVWCKTHSSLDRRYPSCFRKSSTSRHSENKSTKVVSERSVTQAVNAESLSIQGSSMVYAPRSSHSISTSTASTSGRTFQSRTTPYSGRRRPQRDYHLLQPTQLVDALLADGHPNFRDFISRDHLYDLFNRRVTTGVDNRQDAFGSWYSRTDNSIRPRRSSHFLRILNRPPSLSVWQGENRSPPSTAAFNTNEPIRYMDMENDVLDDYGQSEMNLESDIASDNHLLPEFIDLGESDPPISSLTDESDDDRAYRILRLCRRIWGSRRIVSLRQIVADSESGGEADFDCRISLAANENDDIAETEPENIDGDDDDEGDEDDEEDDENENEDDHGEDVDVDNEKYDDEGEEEGDDMEDSDGQLGLDLSEDLTSETTLLLAQLVAEFGHSGVNGQESLVDQLGINFSGFSRSFLNRTQRATQHTTTTTTTPITGASVSVSNSLASSTMTATSTRMREVPMQESVESPTTPQSSTADFRHSPTSAQTDSRVHSSTDPVREWDAHNDENEEPRESTRQQEVDTVAEGDEEAVDIHPNILDLDDPELGMDMWAFSDNVEDDVLFTLALQLSLRDQGGPGTRESIERSNREPTGTPYLQSISQEGVSIPGNEITEQDESNNEQDFVECEHQDQRTNCSGEPEHSDTNLTPTNSVFPESLNQPVVTTSSSNPNDLNNLHHEEKNENDDEELPDLHFLFAETPSSPKPVDETQSRNWSVDQLLNITDGDEDNANLNVKSDEMMLIDNEDTQSVCSSSGSDFDSAPESNIIPLPCHQDTAMFMRCIKCGLKVTRVEDYVDNNYSDDGDYADDDNRIHDHDPPHEYDITSGGGFGKHSNQIDDANNLHSHHHHQDNNDDGENDQNNEQAILSSIKSLKKLRLDPDYRRQNLALLFCLNLATHLSREWPDIINQFKQSKCSLTTSPGSSQHFVPILQFIISLIRVLHANACQLYAEVISLQLHQQSVTGHSTTTTSSARLNHQDKFYLEYIKQLLVIIKDTLKQLIRVLIHGVIKTALTASHAKLSKSTNGESASTVLNTVHLRESLEEIVNLDCSLLLEFIVLQLQALIEIFGSIPSSSATTTCVASLPLMNLWLCGESISDDCKKLNQSPLAPQQQSSLYLGMTTANEQANILSNDERDLRTLIDQIIEFCLTLMETLYARVLKFYEFSNSGNSGEMGGFEQGDVKDLKCSVFTNYPNAISNPLACGFLQSSLFSLQNCGDTVAGTLASGLLSWSPLLSGSHCLDYIGNPMTSQLGWLATKACVKLPNILLYLLSSLLKDKSVSSSLLPSSSCDKQSCHPKVSYLSSEFESRWCSVLFNYKELLNHPNLFQSHFTSMNPISLQGNNNPESMDSNNLFQFINVEGSQQTSKVIYPLGRELQSLLVSIVGPKSYRQLQDVHRLAKLLQRIRDICVNTGGLVLHLGCFGSMQFTTGGPPCTSSNDTNNLSTNLKFHLNSNSTTATDDQGLNSNRDACLHDADLFTRQLRLPYIAQREILENISSCLVIAVRNTAYWQRLCLRSSGTLLFLLHASLVLDRKIARNMLYLIQLAICPGSLESRNYGAPKHSHDFRRSAYSSIQATEMKLSRITARYLIHSRNSRNSTCSEISVDENTPNRLDCTEFNISPLFIQFIRTFLCQCPKKSIRDSAAHILLTIFSCVSRETQSHILGLISFLWSELPTFVPYSSQFVQLSIHLLNSYPMWSGRAHFIEQVVWILVKRLEALKRHPNRTLYSVLMHFAHSQKGFLPGVLIPSESSKKSRSVDRRTDEFAFLQSASSDSSTTRTWASVAAQKPCSSQVPPSSNGSSGGRVDTTETGQLQFESADSNFKTLMSPNSAFTFELEPCLLCHAKAIDEPFYIILRWDSEPSVSRRSIQSVVSTIYNSRFTHQFHQSSLGTPSTQNLLRTTAQQSNLSTNGTDIQSTSNNNHTSSNPAVPNVSGLIQTTSNIPRISTTSINATTTTTAPTTTTASSNGVGVSGSQANPFSLMIPVQLKSRATSSVHIFDLESSYLISQITVKFNVLSKRPRYVRTLNVYTCDLTDRASARLIHEPQLWQPVACVRFNRSQTTARICFSHPSPIPTWLVPNQEYATDKRITMNSTLVTDSLNLKQSPGLPIRASRLIFEYADFHSTGQEERRVCPRCHASDLQGSTCMMCRSNVNECFRCRSLNLSNEDVYLCANCGTSRHGKIEFSITARPCYSFIEPLHDREDRESACGRILTLSRELGKTSQALSRLVQVDVTECLYRLCSLDTGAIDLISIQESFVPKSSNSVSNNTSVTGKSQTNAVLPKEMPQSAVSTPSYTGFVNPAIIRLINSALKAKALSLDAAVIARRLWAARQSVVEFDVEEQRESVSGTNSQSFANENKFLSPEFSNDNSVKTRLNYTELDKIFYPSLAGCYWCLMSTIYQCSHFLRCIAEFTSSTVIKSSNKTWNDSHWLFGVTSDDDHAFRLFSLSPSLLKTTEKTCITSMDIVHNLVTDIIDSGLNIYPQHLQQELRVLLIQLTKDCQPLISHLGDILSDRIIQTASTHGDQAHLLGPLSYNDVCLLQSSVEAILPRKSQHAHLRKQPIDLKSENWEARLRPLFKILLKLTNDSDFKNTVGCNPSVPVVQNILLPLVESLHLLVSHKPVSSAFSNSSSVPTMRIVNQSTENVSEEIGPVGGNTVASLSISQTGASGETQYQSVVSNQANLSSRNVHISQAPAHLSFGQLSHSWGLDSIGFHSWLANQPQASFSAWKEYMSIQTNFMSKSSSHHGTTLPIQEANSNSPDQQGLLWKDIDSKQFNLVAHFARRWRQIVEEKRWAKRWGVSITSRSSVDAGRLFPDSWLTRIFFSPPDSNARGVYDCMKLLKQITSNFLSKQIASNTSRDSSPLFRQEFASTVNTLFNQRRCAVLRFLTEVCIPRLDELASTRDAALLLTDNVSTSSTSSSVTVSTALSSSRSNCVTTSAVTATAGDIFVTEFCQLTMSEPEQFSDESKQKQHTNATTTAGENTIIFSKSPFIPYLLVKGDFLGHVRILMRKLLLQMTRIESARIGHWNESMAAILSPISGSGACNGGAPGYAIALVAELLSVLKPLKQLTRSQQNQLLRVLLPACAQLRYLVFQRTDCTVKAQSVFDFMLAELTGVSGTQIKEFLSTVLDILAEYPIDDHRSATYLLQRLCTPVCPLDTDQSVFQIKLEVWRPHEDYLLARSRIEILPSDTRGLGPRIHNLIDYICDANNLTTDMRLEIVCEGQILMPQLRLHDVYTQIWCANRNNVNKPMRLRYRIPGLEADNLPYVENLSSEEIPPEQYSHISVLATHPHGLGDLLRRLASSQNAVYSHDLMDVIVHILEYCLKTPACTECLTDPDIKAIPRLLYTLIICLQSKHQKSTSHSQQQQQLSADIPEDITKRLIIVFKSVLELVDAKLNDSAESHQCPVTSSQSGATNLVDLNSVQFLLNFVKTQPNVPNISINVSRLLGLMTFSDEAKMDAIIDFLKVNLDQLKPSAQFTSSENALLDCCCSLLLAIPKNSRNGILFKQRVKQNAMLLQTSLHFLWATFPLSCIDTKSDQSSTTTSSSISNTNDPEVTKFLSEPSLPYVLQLMHVSLDGDQKESILSQPEDEVEEGKTQIKAYQLLHLFHQLETSKSSGRVGLLAEDMLNDWASKEDNTTAVPGTGNRTIGQVIHDLREATVRRARSLAQNMREKRLRSLNMRVNEKGQVAMVETDRLNKMTAVLQEETGLSCVICHEGQRIAPNEALGIYVYVRRCALEENLYMTGCESTISTNPPSNTPNGYSTLSNFVIVHFSCHTKSFRSSSENEWTVAQRHNWDVGCNNILPILSPPTSSRSASTSTDGISSDNKTSSKTGQQQAPDTVYAGHLASFMDFIMHKLSVCPGYVMALHDIKLLLLRFACNRTFTLETGGGGKESNMQLLPHLMQVYLHSLLMSSHVDQELEALKQFAEVPPAYWMNSDKCWNTTGPLYRIVAALHLWSHDEWLKNRVIMLRSLLYMAVGRSNNPTSSNEVSMSSNSTNDSRFAIIKPYLNYFGLIDSAYEYLFKNVQFISTTECKAISSISTTQTSSWPISLSHYIRTSDEALMIAAPKFLVYFEQNLLTIASIEEFLDVTGLLGSVSSEELESIMVSTASQ